MASTLPLPSSLATGYSKFMTLCYKIHDNGSIPLRQLVPVHKALCETCDWSGQESLFKDQNWEESLDLDKMIRFVCQSEQERSFCLLNLGKQHRDKEKIEIDESNKSSRDDAKRLATIQYLTFQLPPLASLYCVVFPYLLHYGRDTDNNESLFSEQLIDAVLETIEFENYDKAEDNSSLLDGVISKCLKSHNDNNYNSRRISCRILVKLVQKLPNNMSLVDTVFEMTYALLEQAIADSNNVNVVISCLAQDILPLLTMKQGLGESSSHNKGFFISSDVCRSHLYQLWQRLFAIDIRNNSATNSQMLLLVTTILCPLLPCILDIPLPTILPSDSDTNKDDTLRLPLNQAFLWDIIYVALSQGKSLFDPNLSSLSPLLRKRALYILRTITENSDYITWKQYTACIETLEMESEQHLVDQIWETVGELLGTLKSSSPTDEGIYNANARNENRLAPPQMNWDWISLMMSRIFSSEQPALRKLGLYRFLKGHAGFQINEKEENESNPSSTTNSNKLRAKKKSKNASSLNISTAGAPLEILAPSFVIEVILPSWDTVGNSMGYTMHLEENGKVVIEYMIPMLQNFFKVYIDKLNDSKRSEFFDGLWNLTLLQKLHIKSIVLVYETSAESLTEPINTTDSMLQNAALAVSTLFESRSIVLSYRKSIIQCLAATLSKCMVHHQEQDDGDSDGNKTRLFKWSHPSILGVLSLYTAEYFRLESEDWDLTTDPIMISLSTWIAKYDQAITVGATIASAFVSRHEMSSATWDPTIGATDQEQQMAWAISLLCTLAATKDDEKTTGSLLWPAIHKGLGVANSAMYVNEKAIETTRALLLLEYGCKLRQLSGMGNGDLVVDRNTQNLMPPPPNIEEKLSSGASFILHRIRQLVTYESASANQNVNAKNVSTTFSKLIRQLQMLQISYPSSMAITSTVSGILRDSMSELEEKGPLGMESNTILIRTLALAFASLSAGANPGIQHSISYCKIILKLELQPSDSESSLEGFSLSSEQKIARSILQYSKWGAISCILNRIVYNNKEQSNDNTNSNDDNKKHLQQVGTFCLEVIDAAIDAVPTIPLSALMPLFSCLITAGRYWVNTVPTPTENDLDFYTTTLSKMIDALFALMEDGNNRDMLGKLNEICALIFQPKLLYLEYQQLKKNPRSKAPIRIAFRKLVTMAGTQRPHILRCAICRITVGWLGPLFDNNDDGVQQQQQDGTSSIGLSAIPYREDIAKLLLHKEGLLDESAKNQSDIQWDKEPNVMQIPKDTDILSVTRAFILVFISKLPDIDKGLNQTVLHDLLHYVILELVKQVSKKSPQKLALVMKGTPPYCLKMRGWQALCILIRFITPDIVQEVCETTFGCLSESLHNQIRYFIEIFTIQCARLHQESFCRAFLKDLARTDLSLQQVSSLMILGGNWIVGRYKLEFFIKDGTCDKDIAHQVLASVIPWLSSTQGFSRAIAQLVVHAIVPLAIDVNAKGINGDDNWYLRTIYKFLDENKEMKRLRTKQMKFFEKYNVDDMCTAEGVLSVPVDEGNEANPSHMVDVIKDCLQEVYLEAHGADAPDWKLVETMLETQNKYSNKDDRQTYSGNDDKTSEIVNFQRKIIPLDSLNLAMEDLREKRLRNSAGRPKQQLIVCASLVDKVPNLGGLARTAEIFAADRLIIPDISVCKMDNFKSLSVGAADWIDIEECREEHLLQWLQGKKSNGYFIVGLEQTSSSVSLSEIVFPNKPTVLLLGKEKEGIPVEFLHVVDQCIEIPQLGIIRSLNVHVSGAIAIWEYTRQNLKTT